MTNQERAERLLNLDATQCWFIMGRFIVRIWFWGLKLWQR